MGRILGKFEGNDWVSPSVRPQNKTHCTEVSSQNPPSMNKCVTGLGLKVSNVQARLIVLLCSYFLLIQMKNSQSHFQYHVYIYAAMFPVMKPLNCKLAPIKCFSL